MKTLGDRPLLLDAGCLIQDGPPRGSAWLAVRLHVERHGKILASGHGSGQQP